MPDSHETPEDLACANYGEDSIVRIEDEIPYTMVYPHTHPHTPASCYKKKMCSPKSEICYEAVLHIKGCVKSH